MGGGMMQGANGNVMRPPTTTPQFANGQMEAMHQASLQAHQAAQNGVRMQNGVNWQQGQQVQAPMMPQGAQPQLVGTPQPRNMPPPSGPPANVTTNGRPASPAAPAPPTPQQQNKANPKAKKGDTKKRERPNNKSKASTTAATPSSEADNPPQTPTPATPITPKHPKTFSDAQKNGNSQAQGVNGQGPTSVPAPAAPPQQPDGNNMMPQFNGLDFDQPIDMTFGPLDGDVMEGFDFDSFLTGDEQNLVDFNDPTLNFNELPIETGTDG